MLFVLWLLYSLPHCFYTAFLASIMPLVFCIFHIYNFFSLNFVVSRFRYTFCLVCLVLLYLVLTTVLQFKLRLSLSLFWIQSANFRKCKGSCIPPRHRDTQRALLQMQSRFSYGMMMTTSARMAYAYFPSNLSVCMSYGENDCRG